MVNQVDRVPVSVIMLTLNEAFHVREAVEKVAAWAEEVFVLDSCSTDDTVTLALAAGARVVQRPFTNFGDQWNWALSHLPIETPWTLKMDPDERLSEPLKRNIGKAVRGDGSPGGYGFLR